MWCGIDYAGFDQPGFGPNAIGELERCVRAGAVGVGEFSDKGGGLRGNAGGMHLDDPRMDPLFEKCADLGLAVNIHVGEDRWMYEPMDATNDGLMNAFKWRIRQDPGILSHHEVVATLDRAVAKHPRTTFIACHFANCCFDLTRLGRMLDTHPNLYADIAARFGETAPVPRAMAKFYRAYQDRLLYGTDMASLLLGHRPPRVCSLVAPRQRAKSPPAKPEFIFAQTLKPHPSRLSRNALSKSLA